MVYYKKVNYTTYIGDEFKVVLLSSNNNRVTIASEKYMLYLDLSFGKIQLDSMEFSEEI